MTTRDDAGRSHVLLRPLLVVATCALALVATERERSNVALRGAYRVRDSETTSSIDADIRAALRAGRLDEARPLLGARLAENASSCVPYRLAVELAQRSGELPRQIREWTESLAGPRSHDAILRWAYAVALSEKGEDEQALDALSAAIAAATPCLDAYRRFVRLSQRRGALEEAEAALRQLEIQRPNDPYLLHALAFLAETRGEGASALAAYGEAIPMANSLPQSYLSASALQVRAGELDRALELSRQGLELASRLGHSLIELDFLIQQAEIFAWLGQSNQSEASFERAIERARAESDGARERDILLTRAALAAALGGPARAEFFFEQVEAIPDPSPTRTERARVLLREGEVLIALGQLSEARARLERAMSSARATRAPLAELDALLGLVQVTREEGASTDALRMTQEALAKAIALEDGRRQAAALLAAATLYEGMGRFDRAVDFLEQVLTRARRDADRTREVLALSNLSLVHLRLGLPVLAVQWAEEARARARALSDRRVQLGVAQSLAAALAGAGRYEEAERVFRSAFSQSEGLAGVELKGLIAAGLGRVLLARGKAVEAREVFDQALALAGGTRSRLVALQARSGRGLALWQEGRLDEALTELEVSLDEVESSRSSLEDEANRIRYAETRAQIYSNLTGILIELDIEHPDAGYGERAFDTNERSRSRALLDMVSRVKPDAEPALLDRVPLSSGEIRSRVLRPGELLLQFALGEKESILWAISPTESRRYELPPRRAIEADVQLFLQAIRTPPRAPFRAYDAHLPHGHRLYRTLIAPAEALVERAEHVILSPHGALNLLPFEALPMDSNEGPNANPRYLIERTVISYAPSASALDRLQGRAERSPPPTLAFFGIAQPAPENLRDDGASSYPSIPFAALELESIAPLFPVEARRVYLGDQASEEAVKEEALRRYRILHFAAHAEVDALAPERSAIVLGTGVGSDGTEDGLLNMGEVLDLDLSSELVVLSGCETGLGQVLETEGTLGLAWAFLSAGSSAVAVSLWNVNDRSTSTVMTAFYSALARGRPAATSLAEAKRTMLRSTRPAYRHPFYWAPFVLVGVGSLP